MSGFSPNLITPLLQTSLFVACLAPCLYGDLTESFEAPNPSWRIRRDSDCPQLKLEVHERVWGQGRSGKRSEHIRVRATGGSYVYATMDAPPSRVISELVPRLWVKSNRAGVQLFVRVVLPRSIDPQTGEPLTTLLPGDAVAHADAWSPLEVRDAPRLLEQAVPRLRREFGSFVDGRGAYVDKLVLNVYGGPGVTRVWIDDLSYPIFPPLKISDPAVQQAQATTPLPQVDTPKARVRGDLLLVRDRPFVARVIEHRGESFASLQKLGFNSILLAAPATPQQLDEAAALGLWLIAPPPPGPITRQHERILAWRLGERLGERELVSVQRLANDLRRRDPEQGRALFLGASEHAWEYRRSADIFLLERPILASQNSLNDAGAYWRNEPERSRLAGVVWASIPTELGAAIRDQVIAHGAGASLQHAYAEPDQIRALAFQAVSSGVRGLLFRSDAPLDREDTTSRMRAKTLELLNHELTLVEPWIAGGNAEQDIESHDPRMRASILRTERSQLLLVTRVAAHQQFVLGSVERGEIGLTTSTISTSAEAYRITYTTLQPMRTSRVPGGFRLRLNDGEMTSLILLTQNPRVMEHVGRTLLEHGPSIAHLRYELAEMHWDRTRQILERLAAIGSALPRSASRLQEARVSLDQCRERLEANDYDWALSSANSAMTSLAQLRRGHWEQAIAAFPTPQAAPLCADFALLPEHWGLSQRIRNAFWSSNAISAGSFENLEHMLQTGWRQHHVEQDTGAVVELSLTSPRSGRRALRLFASRDESTRLPSKRPHVTISSAPVAVRQGQIVRIHGWVRTQTPFASRDGLAVYDNFAGRDYGHFVSDSPGWTEFTLYRAAPRDDYLVVHFELSDYGDALVDDFAVSVLQPPAQLPSPGAESLGPQRPQPVPQIPGSGPEFNPPTVRLPMPSPGSVR